MDIVKIPFLLVPTPNWCATGVMILGASRVGDANIVNSVCLVFRVLKQLQYLLYNWAEILLSNARSLANYVHSMIRWYTHAVPKLAW